jgi:hypothetical protein
MSSQLFTLQSEVWMSTVHNEDGLAANEIAFAFFNTDRRITIHEIQLQWRPENGQGSLVFSKNKFLITLASTLPVGFTALAEEATKSDATSVTSAQAVYGGTNTTDRILMTAYLMLGESWIWRPRPEARPSFKGSTSRYLTIKNAGGLTEDYVCNVTWSEQDMT